MKFHLASLMRSKKIKFTGTFTKQGLGPATRLYLYLKNSVLYQQSSKCGLRSSDKYHADQTQRKYQSIGPDIA